MRKRVLSFFAIFLFIFCFSFSVHAESEPEPELIPISSCSFTAIPKIACTGKPLTPELTIIFENQLLHAGTDYTVKYQNNINPGYGKAIVYGTGRFSGRVTKKFRIILPSATVKSIKQNGFYSVTLSWKKIPQAASYQIFYSLDPLKYGWTCLQRNLTGTSYTHKSSSRFPLNPNKTYYYYVGAKCTVDGKVYGSLVPDTLALIEMTPPRNGLKKENGVYRFYKNDEPQKNTWIEIGKDKYYFKANGSAVTSASYKINNVYYVFGSSGKLLNPSSEKFYKLNGHKYYVAPGGRAVSGWRVVDDYLLYLKANGRKTANATVEEIPFDSSGHAKNCVNTQLKKKVMSVVSQITNSSMSQSQKLRACWNYTTSSRFRYRLYSWNMDKKGWQREAAVNMLNSFAGDCVSFACAFAALAKEIGYEPILVRGRVAGTRDGAADGLTRHCWVKINGRYYDPEAEFAGWMYDVYDSYSYNIRHQILFTLPF